ncbi:MAG: rRNA pseudouridine synthase [Oscillospiraceae bacterium]|nr:rRNA pseudouridine synthase [Oscillospiraceae bacterium]
MSKLRLDKFLADQGLASRKELREIVRSGRVRVNGSAVQNADQKVDPEVDQICFDGRSLSASSERTLMLYKPLGVVSATEDRNEKTVLDLLPPEYRRMGLSPVGRLDKDTSGLLLLSNDGDFIHRVISPKSAVEKCYCATVEGEPNEEDVKAFREGLPLRDGTKCLPAQLELLGDGRCLVRVTEGKYHQVRRMLASRGHPVKELKRLSIGDLILDEDLGPGGWKELGQEDLCRVFRT